MALTFPEEQTQVLILSVRSPPASAVPCLLATQDSEVLREAGWMGQGMGTQTRCWWLVTVPLMEAVLLALGGPDAKGPVSSGETCPESVGSSLALLFQLM